MILIKPITEAEIDPTTREEISRELKSVFENVLAPHAPEPITVCAWERHLSTGHKPLNSNGLALELRFTGPWKDLTSGEIAEKLGKRLTRAKEAFGTDIAVYAPNRRGSLVRQFVCPAVLV